MHHFRLPTVLTALVFMAALGCENQIATESPPVNSAWKFTTQIWDSLEFWAGMGLLVVAAFSVLTLKRQPMPETILLTPDGPAILTINPPRRVHYAALALAFLVIAAYGSWVPFNFRPLTFSHAWEMVRATSIFDLSYSDRSDWATNALLFIPIGFCSLAACTADKQDRTLTFAMIPLILPAGVALSFVIEFVQLWLPGRVFSQSDIAAQTIGTIMGIVFWLTIGQTVTAWVRSYTGNTAPKRQIEWLLQAYLLGLTIYSVVPLNLTINPEELYEKYRSGRVILVPFTLHDWSWTLLGDYLTDALIFIPVGALAAIAWMPPHRPLRPLPESIFLGAVIVTALEFCQLLVQSRFTDATDIVVGTVGVAIGAWLMHRFSPQAAAEEPLRKGLRSWHWFTLAVAYAIFLVAYFWRPFEITEDADLIRERFQRILSVPGASLYSVSEFRAITEILRKTLLFALLGALLTRVVQPGIKKAKMRRLLLVGCTLVAFCVGMVIELGQVLIIAHTPDTSDALLCTLGAAAGIFITSRLLRQRG